MSSLEEARKKFISSEYNLEDVCYCKECLSLAIMDVKDENGNVILSFCKDCGRTDYDTTDIFTWEKMFKDNYGYNFINFNKYGREND